MNPWIVIANCVVWFIFLFLLLIGYLDKGFRKEMGENWFVILFILFIIGGVLLAIAAQDWSNVYRHTISP